MPAGNACVTDIVLCSVCCAAGHSSSCVAEAVKYSEESRTKCIGLTIETRPDYCLGPHLRDMLSYGCTRLEMGVQVRLLAWLMEDKMRIRGRQWPIPLVTECLCELMTPVSSCP